MNIAQLQAYEPMLKLASHWAGKGIDDFSLAKTGKGYTVTFTPGGPFYREWLPEAYIEFSPANGVWMLQAGDIQVFNSGCPFAELVMELRGYLPSTDMLAEDTICLDIGTGSSGYLGLVCSKLSPRGTSLFLEADPRAFGNCMKNVMRNGLSNYFLFQQAVSPNLDPVVFSLSDEVGGSRIGDTGGGMRVEAETITLERLLQIADAREDSTIFVKMDIEGTENALTEHITECLERHSNAFFSIASYHKVDGEETNEYLMREFGKTASLMCVATPPRHRTTYVCHRDNEAGCTALERVASAG